MEIRSVVASQKKATYLHIGIWTAAAIVGSLAVLFAKLISWSQSIYFDCFREHAYIVSIASPLLFVLATWLVRRFAPEAKGSGIPQVLEAIDLAHEQAHLGQTKPEPLASIWMHKLISLRTATIKVLSATVGIFGGASIGREGPTVQIAASGFAWVGNLIRRFYPEADFSSFITAGAAAGVAAAFNTPLAGITFAIEEITEGVFGPFRQLVILGVVIAGITAQALSGNYLYFGHPNVPENNFTDLILLAIPLGIIAGFAGGLFARALAHPAIFRLPKSWWLRAFVLGAACSAIGLATNASTAGSGYEITRQSLDSMTSSSPDLMFPIWKFLTTVFSYLSGMAGGIFSPCLSIGAGIGFSFASILQLSSLKVCALFGMVAFFSAVVQAPLTAVIIVTEMTDQHALILPFLVAAFLAQGVGRIMMPVPLYRYLANQRTSG